MEIIEQSELRKIRYRKRAAVQSVKPSDEKKEECFCKGPDHSRGCYFAPKPQSTRGGKRPGAGRKPTGVSPLHCYPQARTVTKLRQMSAARGRTIGQVLDSIIESGAR